MMLTMLDRLRQGMLVSVFDATDRIQHMFWRYLDGEATPATRHEPHAGAIESVCRRNDALVWASARAVGGT
jgi:predicted AlkP superfamily phosphohydrolase/phosphomutase